MLACVRVRATNKLQQMLERVVKQFAKAVFRVVQLTLSPVRSLVASLVSTCFTLLAHLLPLLSIQTSHLVSTPPFAAPTDAAAHVPARKLVNVKRRVAVGSGVITQDHKPSSASAPASAAKRADLPPEEMKDPYSGFYLA